MKIFDVSSLPEIDQEQIKRGLCPWCLEPLVDGSLVDNGADICPDCGDEFVGVLTIDD